MNEINSATINALKHQVRSHLVKTAHGFSSFEMAKEPINDWSVDEKGNPILVHFPHGKMELRNIATAFSRVWVLTVDGEVTGVFKHVA